MATKLNLQTMKVLIKAAKCLKVMGHPVRLRIVDILMQGDFVVYEVAKICEIPPPQACEHLRLMKRHGFLNSKRKGKAVYYKIHSNPLPKLLKLIEKPVKHEYSTNRNLR